MSLAAQLQQLEQEALAEIARAAAEDDIDRLRVRYLGRKGAITQVLRGLGKLSPEERPAVGQEANRVKAALEAALEERATRFQADRRQAEEARRIDVTLPGRRLDRGRLHPITQVTREICDIFIRLGFQVVEGPEVETDYYNFEALNIPKDHPARDMQDTFYVS